MTIHPTLLSQSARYRQEELRGLGDQRLGGKRLRERPLFRSARVWRRPRLRLAVPSPVHPRPASSR